jgi:hypothetical protein
MWDMMSLRGLSSGAAGYRFQIDVWSFPLEDFPGRMASWPGALERRWVEKGVWLGERRRE